jgi:uracil-DNA glycosylase
VVKSAEHIDQLVAQIRKCTLCADLPLGPKPIVQASVDAKILVVGQAPGRITHVKGRPFDDASGKRLRTWLGVAEDVFYDPTKIAIIPMGFCFPGTGKGGDAAPRPQCARHWRRPLLDAMPRVELSILLGKHALDWHIGSRDGANLTDTVRNWREYWPENLPLPHPSPRNNRWLKRNPWFEAEIIPVLQSRIRQLLGDQ